MAHRYRFNDYDNPTRDALLTVDPAFDVPADYQGNNSNLDLARTVLHLVSQGRDFADVTKHYTSDYQGGFLDNVEGFEALFTRYNAPCAAFLFFTTVPSLSKVNDHGSAWYYMLWLATYYGDRVEVIAPTVQRIIELPDSEGRWPTVETLDRFNNLNTQLRREGVVLDMGELFLCAETIDADELIKVLAANFTVERVMPLVRLGFVTADQIISHREDLPMNWVNQLLGIKF